MDTERVFAEHARTVARSLGIIVDAVIASVDGVTVLVTVIGTYQGRRVVIDVQDTIEPGRDPAVAIRTA